MSAVLYSDRWKGFLVFIWTRIMLAERLYEVYEIERSHKVVEKFQK